LSSDGHIFHWGFGILGHSFVPQNITSIPNKIVDIQIGRAMGSAIDESQMVWVWGDNSKGELGVGDYSERKFPYPVVGLKGKSVKSISIGSKFSIVIGDTININKSKKNSPEPKRVQSVKRNK
jgi:alpha-tubulin suppressor-like RCC1 family protein